MSLRGQGMEFYCDVPLNRLCMFDKKTFISYELKMMK